MGKEDFAVLKMPLLLLSTIFALWGLCYIYAIYFGFGYILELVILIAEVASLAFLIYSIRKATKNMLILLCTLIAFVAFILPIIYLPASIVFFGLSFSFSAQGLILKGFNMVTLLLLVFVFYLLSKEFDIPNLKNGYLVILIAVFIGWLVNDIVGRLLGPYRYQNYLLIIAEFLISVGFLIMQSKSHPSTG